MPQVSQDLETEDVKLSTHSTGQLLPWVRETATKGDKATGWAGPVPAPSQEQGSLGGAAPALGITDLPGDVDRQRPGWDILSHGPESGSGPVRVLSVRRSRSMAGLRDLLMSWGQDQRRPCQARPRDGCNTAGTEGW